jgi:hypothetical protein
MYTFTVTELCEFELYDKNESHGDLFSSFHILVLVFTNIFRLTDTFLRSSLFWVVMQCKAMESHSRIQVLSYNSITEVLSNNSIIEVLSTIA